MNLSTIIGSFGVSLLLIAFFLNLFQYVSPANKAYMLLNIAGAALSCYASLLIRYVPFVILEAVWCLVALAGLIRSVRGPAPRPDQAARGNKDVGVSRPDAENVKKGNPPRV